MSLRQLCSTHSCDVHPLTRTKGDMLGDIESIGARTATRNVRMIPMDRADRVRYGVSDESEAYRALFHEDPGLDSDQVLVWDGKVWRIVEAINSGGADLAWHAMIFHDPQMAAPVP